MFGLNVQNKVAQSGSINGLLLQNMSENSKHNYKIIIETNNCLEFKGEVNDMFGIDINSYGKPIKFEVNKMQINNTKIDN